MVDFGCYHVQFAMEAKSPCTEMTLLNNSSLLGAQFVTIVDLSNVINVNDANKDSFEITLKLFSMP